MLSGWKRREPVNSVANLTRDLLAVERERDAALARAAELEVFQVAHALLYERYLAALAVIEEVREALAPGQPLYASLAAARAALEKVSD